MTTTTDKSTAVTIDMLISLYELKYLDEIQEIVALMSLPALTQHLDILNQDDETKINYAKSYIKTIIIIEIALQIKRDFFKKPGVDFYTPTQGNSL